MATTRDLLLARLGMYQEMREAGKISSTTPALIPIEEVLKALDADATDSLVWEPTKWWRSVEPDGSRWGESSNEEEVRRMAKPGQTIQQLWRGVSAEWRTPEKEN